MPNESAVTLHPNAVFAFFLRRAGHMTGLVIAMVILFVVPTCHSGMTVNGHPATAADYHFVNHLRWLVLGVVLVILIVQGTYCFYLAQSYRIEMHKDGVMLKYGVFNLSDEVLLFAKIQDVVIRRSVLERMLGISTVTIQNAMGKPEVIPGLGEDTAATLRETILGHISR